MQNFEKYAKFYDLIYREKNYKEEAEMVYEWADKPTVIVDLGCGTGRHHKYWHCFVIGIDRSRKMLLRTTAAPKRCYIVSNMETDIALHYAPCYTALFNVMGYCNLEHVISQMKQSTGGIFILDVWDKDKVRKDGFIITIKEYGWGKVVVYPIKEELLCKEVKAKKVIKKLTKA